MGVIKMCGINVWSWVGKYDEELNTMYPKLQMSIGHIAAEIEAERKFGVKQVWVGEKAAQ